MINAAVTAAGESATEIIADAIVAISDGIKRLRNGRLNDRALVMLIQSAAPGKVTVSDIRSVLAGIERLRSSFLRR